MFIFVILRLLSYSLWFVKLTGSSSSSSRYCQRNKSYVQTNCQCSTYQQLSCIPPSGCGYNGEGGYRSTNTGDSSSSSSRYGGGRDLSTKSSTGEALAELLRTNHQSHRGLCGLNWDSRCECCCELVNSGEMTVVYTTSEGGKASSESSEGDQSSSSAKPKPKPKPKPHPKSQTAENDASSVERSGIGRVHFIIGGSLLCALGVFLLDQKARRSNWGRQRTAENVVRYDNENGPQTHYVIAVV